MASRTAYAGTATAGQVLTAANVNNLPGGWIGFVEVTTAQSGISAITDLTGLSQAVTVNNTRKIKITFHSPGTLSTVAGDRFRYYVREGATILQTIEGVAPGTSRAEGMTMTWSGNPSSGSHTYKISLERITGTGTLTAAADADGKMQMLIEDIGPSS